MNSLPKRAARTTVLLSCMLAACSSGVVRQEPRERHNVVQCTIYGMDQRPLRRFNGTMCAFHPDGRVAAYGLDQLQMRDPTGRILWVKHLTLHHQLKFDSSFTRLLTLATTQAELEGQALETDESLVLDLDGNILHRFNFLEHADALRASRSPSKDGRKWLSHANSIYEILPNARAKIDPAFRPGNYIINSTYGLTLTFILDHEMKKVLWLTDSGSFDSRQIHDVQVLPSGDLLLFRNEGLDAAHPDGCCSSLARYDVSSGLVVWNWAPQERRAFYSPTFGSVQLLPNGNYLFNNGAIGYAREITSRGETVWQLLYCNHQLRCPVSFVDIKRYDLSSFLEHSRDLHAIPTPGDSVGQLDQDILFGYPEEQEVFQFDNAFHAAFLRTASENARTELGGVTVKADGSLLPMFLIGDRFFAARVPPSGDRVLNLNSVQVRWHMREMARIHGPVVEVYPHLFMAPFKTLR